MRLLKNLLAGFAGAVVLNIVHESLKQKGKNMPRVDLLGAEALQKSANYFGAQIDDDKLYSVTLASDLISNALFYSLIGVGDNKYLWARAGGYGLLAGAGAIALPEYLGLNPTPVTKSNKTKAFTILYYLTGAITTGCVIKAINNTSNKNYEHLLKI